jgi:hypothetical protein
MEDDFMKRILFLALFASIAIMAGLPVASANDYFNGSTDTIGAELADSGCGHDGDDCGCDDCVDGICDSTCGCGGFYGSAELLLFKYYRADGVRAGSFNNVPPATTDDIKFDYNTSPRLTVGFVGDSGIGGRIRYWEYAQAGTPVFPASGVAMTVDTYNIDVEMFERVQVSDCWDLELSGGMRYNEFDETMSDPVPSSLRQNSFTGYGGIVGLEAIRKLGSRARTYGRARFGIMQDDHIVSNQPGPGAVQNAILRDSTNSMLEIAMGMEWNRVTSSGSLVFGRIGYEWQHWTNFSTSFTPVTTTPPGNPQASFAGQSDIGFGGVAFALGVER